MPKFILKKEQQCNSKEFVDFWSRQYDYPNETLYSANIGSKLTETKILELFTWKNGTTLSKKKKRSVLNNYVSETGLIAEGASPTELKKYLKKPGGTIWRIFWIHCNYPSTYPIYDQHVHRSMAFLLDYDHVEIPQTNRQKIDEYVDNYLKFHNSFKDVESKKLDEALWGFGKFLSFNYPF